MRRWSTDERVAIEDWWSFCDSPCNDAGERSQVSVAQEEHAIDDTADACRVSRGHDHSAAESLKQEAVILVVEQPEFVPCALTFTDCRNGTIGAMDGGREFNAAGVWAPVTSQAMQQRGFAGAGSANNGHTLAALDVEGTPAQDPYAGGAAADARDVALPEIANLDGVCHTANMALIFAAPSPKSSEEDQFHASRHDVRVRWACVGMPFRRTPTRSLHGYRGRFA